MVSARKLAAGGDKAATTNIRCEATSDRDGLVTFPKTRILVASPLVVYDRVEVVSAAVVEREP
jgi:hypothetical protein